MTNFNVKEDIEQKAKNSPATALMKYIKLRNVVPMEDIAVVEGSEDSLFYSTIFARLGVSSIKHFFVANGKDNVLGLRDILVKSREMSFSGGTIFMVDKDFDALKSYSCRADTYITPTYSIENILVCKIAFEHILLTDFKMCDGDCANDVQKALQAFDKFIDQHSQALEEANRLIHYVRIESLNRRKLTCGSISEKLDKFADMDIETFEVVKKATGNELQKLISIRDFVLDEVFDKKHLFDELDPTKDWRGKFIFFLYKRFLAFLVEDRNKKEPTFFSVGKGKISLSTTADSIIRTIATFCLIPPCLSRFAAEISTRKLVCHDMQKP